MAIVVEIVACIAIRCFDPEMGALPRMVGLWNFDRALGANNESSWTAWPVDGLLNECYPTIGKIQDRGNTGIDVILGVDDARGLQIQWFVAVDESGEGDRIDAAVEKSATAERLIETDVI